MQRTLLQIVTSFCERRAINTPATVVGSLDAQIRQIRSLLEDGCRELVMRGPWEALTKQCLITTINNEDQGAMTTLAAGYKWMLPETLWDRTNKRSLIGRLTPREWQYIKAIVVQGPLYTFRVRGGRFLVNPAPPAGETWAFEYIMETFAETTAGSDVFVGYFTSDDNIILLPDDVVLSDLTWRWKKEKGLTYAQDFEDFERLVATTLGLDGGSKPPIDASCDEGTVRPGVFVPQYNSVP